MILLRKGCEPEVLVKNREAWTAEYVKWHEDREGPEPGKYRHKDIKAALEAETHEKCAYCEGWFKPFSYGHIEHKLPKSRRPELVCAWTNLTIACQVCNMKKRDYYDPDCRLLDPHVDDVEKLVVFVSSLAHAEPGSQAARTIKKLKLNRPALVNAREKVLEALRWNLDQLERYANMPDLVDELLE